MVPVGREGSQFLVDHREEIMRGFAELHLFPGMEWKEQRKRMKTIILGYDMDSGVDAWATIYGNPDGKTVAGKTVPLASGRPYALDEYRAAQRGATAWMADQSSRMLQFVDAAMTAKDRAAKKDPRRRVKSYLLQEAEAVSRAAKMAWCQARRLRVVNLQHDGIVVYGLPAGEEDATAAELSAAASAACGYAVVVEAEKGALSVD